MSNKSPEPMTQAELDGLLDVINNAQDVNPPSIRALLHKLVSQNSEILGVLREIQESIVGV